jgi:hypothetical protein
MWLRHTALRTTGAMVLRPPGRWVRGTMRCGHQMSSDKHLAWRAAAKRRSRKLRLSAYTAFFDFRFARVQRTLRTLQPHSSANL